MKVITSIDLERDGINITCAYERQLVENCGKESAKYTNNMTSFQDMLQEVADKAFELGKNETFKHQ